MKRRKAPKKAPPVSQRAFAKRMGCAPRAVAVAVRDGRIPPSLVGSDGKILDPDAAEAAWKANTLADRRPLTGPTSGGADEPSLLEARSRHELAKAQLAEIELEEKLGNLVEAAKVEAVMVAEYSAVRTKMLGVPSRMRQRDPTTTPSQFVLLKSLIREALEDLSKAKREVEAA